MVDVATMRKLDPEQFGEAADGYRSIGTMAGAAKSKVDEHIVGKMTKALKGEGADAALKAVRGLGDNFHYTQTECGLIHTALNTLTGELRAAKKKFDRAEEDARNANCTVNPDGSVTYPPGGDEVDGKKPEGGTVTGSAKGRPTGKPIDPAADANSAADALRRQAANANPNPHYGKAVDIAERIAEALDEATRADQKWAPRLRRLKADNDLHVSRKDWLDVKKDMASVRKAAREDLKPPKKGSPQQNAKWWKSLSKDDRDAYVSLYPAAVGAMDGLPADARDEANRTVLAETKAQHQSTIAAAPPEPPNKYKWVNYGGTPFKVRTDEWSEWNDKYGKRVEHAKSSLRGIQGIEARFEQTGREKLPDAYLLGFDSEGNGRAIIANGNPDTAKHQAVYVPGTESRLENIEGNIGRMSSLWREAQRLTPNEPVSTITWLGYDAPQEIATDSPFRHYADDGAPAYNRFMDGLEASHTGPSEPHRTAVGHSYGTTLIGSAARQGDLNADDVIFAGSPGVQVGSAEEMDVPKGHVWNAEADGDIVPEIGRAAHGGSQWRWRGAVGIIPSDDIFGANQMSTDSSSWGFEDGTSAHGHSEYWDKGTTSLKNQAQVVAGKYGNVQLED